MGNGRFQRVVKKHQKADILEADAFNQIYFLENGGIKLMLQMSQCLKMVKGANRMKIPQKKKNCYKALQKIKDYFSQKQCNSKAYECIESIRNTIETIEHFTMKHWLLNNK